MTQADINQPDDETLGPRFWSRRKVTLAIVGAVFVAIWSTFSILVVVFDIEPVRVEGMSMSPTLNNGDRVLVERSFTKINRGDLVVFWNPNDKSYSFLKRVIGLPNETIAIHHGKTVIDGFTIEERYIKPQFSTQDYDIRQQLIPMDRYYLMGDNRDVSNDSRLFGPVERRLIYGKVIGRYWTVNSK